MTNAGTGISGHAPADPRNGAQGDLDSPGEPSRRRSIGSGARISGRVTGRQVCLAAMVLGVAMVLVTGGMTLQYVLDHRVVVAAAESGSRAAPADPHAGDFVGAGSVAADPQTARPRAVGPPRAQPPPLAATQDRASRAVAIHIPRLNLNKSLVDLHVQTDSTMSVPQTFSDVGWWSAGPRPGGAGATLIAGHVDSKSGPAVFYRLKDLIPGDRVTIDRADHTTAVFRVVGKASYPRANFPDDVVYRVSGKPSIHLVTCDALDYATGHHTANLVVFADLVSTGPTRHPVR